MRDWYDAVRESPETSDPDPAPPAEGPSGSDGVSEVTCERCGRPNAWSWHAPSPLWNAVMRDPTTGRDRWNIVCPSCFAELAEEAGIGQDLDGRPRLVWHFAPHNLDIAELWTDPAGRRWDPAQCLWVEP